MSSDPIVPRKVEKELDKKMHEEANRICHEEIRVFAECATGRTVSAVWACRHLNTLMVDCHRPHSNNEKLNALKRAWISEQQQLRLKNAAASIQ